MRTVKIYVYEYHELSPAAREVARQWWIDSMHPEDYAEYVIEDAGRVAERVGIEFNQREYKTYGGHTRHEPCVWWSGFSCQGDGASFEGCFRSKAGNLERVAEYAPQDEWLQANVAQLLDKAHALDPGLTCRITTRGSYSHSNSMEFDFDWPADEVSEKDHEEARGLAVEACRNFADWIYRQLQEEYEYRCSEESVAEACEANEYTFTEDGRRYG